MLDEISAAVLFLVRLIEKSENFNQDQLQDFKARLSELLVERFKNHWFPETPFKGQGYRCIRVNERDRRDVTLERAAIACGLKYEDLKLPVELTLWVDPNEVCCRFGEHRGSYCTLASFNAKENKENMQILQKDEIVTIESKSQVMTPLAVSRQLQIQMKRPARSKQLVPKSKCYSNIGFQTLHSWYSLIPPPPPLLHQHHQIRNSKQHSQTRRWNGLHQLPPSYGWHKPTLKV